jgi:hypothetical protein
MDCRINGMYELLRYYYIVGSDEKQLEKRAFACASALHYLLYLLGQTDRFFPSSVDIGANPHILPQVGP